MNKQVVDQLKEHFTENYNDKFLQFVYIIVVFDNYCVLFYLKL